MKYLSAFEFPNIEQEYSFRTGMKRTCYNTIYPFFILSKHHLTRLEFEQITILYGGNGSGKTTALNVIAETLHLQRDTLYNRSNFFEDYTNYCTYKISNVIPSNSRIITSDDVFDFMLNIRSVNEGIDRKREELFDEYLDMKYSHFQMKSLDDYEQLKNIVYARKRTTSQSRYVRDKLMANVREQSNGESGFLYFTSKIRENGLYLLDEPENSLSPERQLELMQYIEESTRFFGCQFIIATHSPFFLSLRESKIYDLDEEVVKVKDWTELKNVRIYYDFFKQHEKEFADK